MTEIDATYSTRPHPGRAQVRQRRLGDRDLRQQVELDGVAVDRQRFVDNTPPFFRPVRRGVPRWAPARGALHRVYAGPTHAERVDGLRVLRSRSTGLSDLRIARSKIARVQLTGGCNSGGSTVTVAGHLAPTLRQFRSVRWVKISDPRGGTEQPSGRTDSIPECLEP